MSRYRANRLANDLWREHVNSYSKTDVAKLARAQGVRIFYDELDDDISGLLIINGEKASIFVNNRHHPNRQRFTIAHELGHYLLHQPEAVHVDREFSVQFRNVKSSSGEDPEEIESNQFAADILMPKNVIAQYLEENDILRISESVIEAMASFFEVSQQAMTIRLAALKYIEV